MAKIFGIDLSYHNGTVDFKKVKAEGVEFVILRCGYASTSNRNSYGKDTKFETYYKDAKAAGLAVGSYFYSRCNNNATAKAEAEFILKCIAGKSFEYPIWLDVEDQSTLSSANKETMTTAIETCLDTIKNAGYKVGIYTGIYIIKNNLIQSRIDKYDVWIAQWANSCSYTGNLCMWQFGGETNKLRSVKINGVSSAACDQNYSAIDYANGEESTGENNPFTGDEITSGGTGGNGGGSGGITGPGNLYLTFNNTTTAQESLPNANVSDNWVDMHRIKGITLHMYPPYHNCKADSMATYFKTLGWDRNFHYKVDKDTKVDFSKKPVSGSTTGGNKVGSSVSDFNVTPKDPLNTGVTITGDENGVYIDNAGSNGGSSGGGGGGGGDTGTPSAPGTPIEGSNVATKIYNYCVSQGCSCAAACGIVGNAQRESGFDPTLAAYDGSGSIGLFQWLATRRTALEKAAKTAGVSYKDADFQIQYMWSEWTSSYYMNQLKKKYNMTLADFKALSSPERAATVFERIFEVSAETTKLREQYARKWYNKFSASSSSAEFLEAEILTDEILYHELSETSDEPFGWPVPGQEYIQSYYGYRQDVLGYKYHPGIDIVNMAGYGAYCYADGRVEKVLTNSVLSGYVRVNHGNGLETIYGSLQTIYVQEGEKVVGGQCIGLTNTTDANSLMHLHFGMKINNQYVDPLYYVQPGGGNKEVPDCYYGVTASDITDTNENITWDNVDKGKICFASAENNTHTYIDANLFNNQHAKYTLSIGSFFYDEFDLVEKSKEVDYPATEKILIEQTAKALYDEGFTSKELWREFDLNRAPSPFLYLDKDKWVAFCTEVDKQVEWLNKKYGIVTATYKPNELLENQNKNEFVETAPGGASNNTGGGGGGGDSEGGEDTGGVTNPGSGSLGWPVPGISTISSKFGPRKAPTAGASTNHKGIDIPGATGTKIVAADSGKVVLAKTGYNWGRGTYMVIDHGNGMGTLYQHLSKITASLGSSVSKGDKIAEMGNTGIGTGSHLHFEVHTGFSGTKGTPVDPQKYVSAGKSSVGDFTIMAQVQDGGAGSPQIDVSFQQDENSYTGLHLSGLGASSIDNGGVMEYSVGKPEDKNAKQPEINTIITQEEYYAIMEYATSGQIELYANSFEPYDKDLDIAKTIGLQNDARLGMLTNVLRTMTENIIRYIVVETGPGSIDHCVKPVDELSSLYMISDCMCDPIYPDLIIPPKYVTSAYDALSKNSIPMRTVEDATITLEDALDKSYSYDYELLDEVTKETTGKPINYYDPYPYDDKITDLENHLPKVLIDEIESRVYSCNHPGCPIAHPMAKNFAMLNDMAINQSKYTEQRLVQIENVLATMVRYLGRMSSRMNINCVYYGGQTVMGKYKCIRCLRDNRIQDGATVTIDQCLSCTRYEPIIGQVYDILDETGFNGSAILDDMQMSYMSLDDMKNLNLVEKRNTTYNYADTNKKEEEIPKSLIEEWKEKDLAKYKEENKITNDDEISPSKYLFMMDWNRQAFDLQRPDVKDYPTEAISAKYYDQAGDPGEEVEEKTPAEKLADLFTPKEVYDKLAEGEWVDTRKEDDNMEINRYTSLDYYFENFNQNRTGYEYDNGLVGNVGLETTGGPGGSDWGMESVTVSGYNNGGGSGNGNEIKDSVNGTGSEIRNKIVEYAYKVVKQNKDKEATYCGSHRTVDPNKLVRHGGSRNGCSNPICYDCTGLVSAAYRYAGLSSFYNKNASGGSLVAEALSNSAQIWEGNKAGFEKALPGDIIMVANSKISNFNPKNPPSTYHAMIYTGTNEVSHASGNYEPGKAIKTQNVGYNHSHYGGKMFFIRCKELITADAKAEAAATSGSANVVFESGTIDGNKYVCKLLNARTTEYGPWDGSGTTVASGKGWSSVVNKSVASHNLPYGTKLYIPSLKGKVNSTGIFTVEDTGGYCFDFDIATSKSYGVTGYRTAYILSYGSGKVSASFTYGRKVVDPNGTKYVTAWKAYMAKGGCLIHFSKFNDDDAKASWWK